MNKPALYLASSSPRRKALLKLLPWPFCVLNIDVKEQQQAHENAITYVQRLSVEKALAGVSVAPMPLPVLGADTLIVCDEKVLEKPRDKQDCFDMLTCLSGRSHQVLTAIAVADEHHVLSKLVTTTVFFKPLTALEIDNYWQSKEPIDKAGSYAIQGRGGQFVTRIEGSYHAVVGLPLYETHLVLTEFEILRGKKL